MGIDIIIIRNNRKAFKYKKFDLLNQHIFNYARARDYAFHF